MSVSFNKWGLRRIKQWLTPRKTYDSRLVLAQIDSKWLHALELQRWLTVSSKAVYTSANDLCFGISWTSALQPVAFGSTASGSTLSCIGDGGIIAGFSPSRPAVSCPKLPSPTAVASLPAISVYQRVRRQRLWRPCKLESFSIYAYRTEGACRSRVDLADLRRVIKDCTGRAAELLQAHQAASYRALVLVRRASGRVIPLLQTNIRL